MSSARTAASHSAKTAAKIASTGPLRAIQSASLLEVTGGNAAIVVIGLAFRGADTRSYGGERAAAVIPGPERSGEASRRPGMMQQRRGGYFRYSVVAAKIARTLCACDFMCCPP